MSKTHENSKDYPNYGGRDIAVCNEWKHDFMSFYDWAMLNGYKEGLQIDRIDNNGNYEPSNCRWSTRKQQCRNRRSNITYTINGITKCLFDWCVQLNINCQTAYWWYHNGKDVLKKLEERYYGNA